MNPLIQSIDQRLAWLERGLAMVLTAGIAAIMMTQVVLRYFFSAPIFWAEEVSVQLLVFATMLGISLLVVMLVLLVFMTKLGWEWINRADVRLELGATTQLPRWYNYSALPIAFAAMAFHQFAAVLRELKAALGAQA